MGTAYRATSPETTYIVVHEPDRFSRSTDGGATWETPIKINDPTSLSDQFFARMAVDETSGDLMIIYYETGTGASRVEANIWMQSSTDDGVTWSSATQVATSSTDKVAASAQADFQYGGSSGSPAMPAGSSPAGPTGEAVVSRRSGVRASRSSSGPSLLSLTAATAERRNRRVAKPARRRSHQNGVPPRRRRFHRARAWHHQRRLDHHWSADHVHALNRCDRQLHECRLHQPGLPTGRTAALPIRL